MKSESALQIVSILVLFSLLLGCTPKDQREIISLLDQAQKTALSEAKTESVPLQTKAVEALKTKIAEGGEAAKTQLANIENTAAARAATEAARILTPQTPTPTFTPTPVQPQVVDYFALGDSVASGHGLQSAKGDTEDGICKRSKFAYPYLLKASLEAQGYTVNLRHLACTGATAGKPIGDDYNGDPIKYRYKWLRNQVIDAEKQIRDDRLTLVTINIGANDIHWNDIRLMIYELNMLPDSFTAWTENVKKQVQDELTNALINSDYGLLTDHPNVYVVMNYLYNPLNPESFIFKLGVSCTIGANLLPVCKLGSQIGGMGLSFCTDFLSTFECKQKADFIITSVNLAVGHVWQNLYKNPVYKNRIWIANVDVAFSGHEAAKGLCGASGPNEADSWIQYLGYPQSNEGIPFLYVDKVVPGDCFHPNMEGAKQIAISVTKRLKNMGFRVP